MLVGTRRLHLGGAMHATLVGERRAANVRLVIVGGEVRNLSNLMREVREVGEAIGASDLVLRLQGEVGEQRHHVRIARALAVAIDRRLHVTYTGIHRREGIRHRELGIVVRVDPPDDLFRCRVGSECLARILHDLRHALGECAAIGVAEDKR